MSEAPHPPSKPLASSPTSRATVRFDQHLKTPPSDESDAWVTTYMDLITLLLTLFIVMLAYADRGKADFESLQRSIAEAVHKPFSRTLEPPSEVEMLYDSIQARYEKTGQNADIEFAFQDGTISIELSERVLFASGEAAFNPQAVETLRPILDLLQNSQVEITVEGHTDNVPIDTPQFPSNWELSSARATFMVRYLLDQGIAPERLRAIGYADSKPLYPNDSPAHQAKNRRVTFVITEPNP